MKFGKSKISLSHDSEGPAIFRLQLTALIDVLTFMLVFLVKSFSVSGDVVTKSDNLALPISTSEKPPRPAAGLEITKQSVLAQGAVLVSLEDVEKSDSLLVPRIYDWMTMERVKYSDTATVREVMIQADREVEYRILKKVMYSCSKAGFTDFTILAQIKE